MNGEHKLDRDRIGHLLRDDQAAIGVATALSVPFGS